MSTLVPLLLNELGAIDSNYEIIHNQYSPSDGKIIKTKYGKWAVSLFPTEKELFNAVIFFSATRMLHECSYMLPCKEK